MGVRSAVSILEDLMGKLDWIDVCLPTGETKPQTKLMDYACGYDIVSLVSCWLCLTSRMYNIHASITEYHHYNVVAPLFYFQIHWL